jgi:hypothetical protein
MVKKKINRTKRPKDLDYFEEGSHTDYDDIFNSDL